MTNSNASRTVRRSGKLWLPSLLLLAQFLTIAPVLLIVFSDETQRRASDGYVALLDGLDRLSFAIAELENIPAADDAAWRQQYDDYRGDLDRILSTSTPSPEVRETLSRMDSIVTRMAKDESDRAGSAAGFRKDGRAARSELLNAQRAVRLELSMTGDSIAQKTIYLKALVAGACLLAFGVVFVVRRFRVDGAIQRRLEQELRTTNEEVIAALAVARSESEVKNRFLAHVGHLIRTLTDRQSTSEQANSQLAESLTKVADQVLDYSRLELGSLTLRSKEFEPAGVVAQVVQLFIPLAEGKRVKLRSSIQEGLPITVRGDPERLRQVLVNLLSNAVHFTQHGEIVLRVEEATGAEGTSLRFEVKDTGAGITEQVRNRIFQPFSTPQEGGAQGNQATGLGLAISKKLVELMGGQIDVTSEPGRGSTFSFTAVFEGAPKSRPTLLPVSPQPSSENKPRLERRTEDRHGTNYPTLLRAESAGIAVIRVLDVSASGFRVSVPFRLLPRTEVEIRIEGTSVVGIVRNCTRISANEFHVGIRIPREASAEEQDRLNHLQMLRIELT
jgi:signal transduction histidine kinase